MKRSILILNGPNLNMLGTREPDIYGKTTLKDIEAACVQKANALKLSVSFIQSNSEEELISHIHEATSKHQGIIINAAALTHTSIAIMDALLGVKLPIIEVHLSNIYKREEFRHHSYVSKAATGVICGLGANGYVLALDAIATHLKP